MSIAEKLVQIAENELKVYNAGYNAGKAAGGGGDGYYDTIWNAIQINGERTDYQKTFNGAGWTQAMFKPKYNIIIKSSNSMFTDSAITDIRPEAIGVTISPHPEAGNVWENFLHGSNVEYVDTIDDTIGLAGTMMVFCGASKLKSVNRFIANEKTQYMMFAFSGCTELTDITVEGGFGNNISFINCTKLSLASAKSILTALKDCAGTDNEFSYTITFAQETWDLLAADGATSPNGTTWQEYVQSKCWTY